MRTPSRNRLTSKTYFVDRNLGKKIVPGILRAAGVQVEAHDDHFAQSATDEHWLREVGARGWIVLTKDHRIWYRLTELKALKEANVRAFVLTPRKLTAEQNGEVLKRALPRMARFVDKTPPPFIAAVTGAAKVVLLKRV